MSYKLSGFGFERVLLQLQDITFPSYSVPIDVILSAFLRNMLVE